MFLFDVECFIVQATIRSNSFLWSDLYEVHSNDFSLSASRCNTLSTLFMNLLNNPNMPYVWFVLMSWSVCLKQVRIISFFFLSLRFQFFLFFSLSFVYFLLPNRSFYQWLNRQLVYIWLHVNYLHCFYFFSIIPNVYANPTVVTTKLYHAIQ